MEDERAREDGGWPTDTTNYIARAAELEARAVVAAEYRLCCSPHEWTDEDSEAMAKYVIAARGALAQERRDSEALCMLLARARALPTTTTGGSHG